MNAKRRVVAAVVLPNVLFVGSAGERLLPIASISKHLSWKVVHGHAFFRTGTDPVYIRERCRRLLVAAEPKYQECRDA